MKKTIQTQSAGQIEISNKFLNNKLWTNSNVHNFNNHKIKVKTEHGTIFFDFWASLHNPEINTDNEIIYTLYCFLSDAAATEQSYTDFCTEFSYELDKKSLKVYKACEKLNAKFNKIFTCDLYNLLNELQNTYDL